MADDQLDATLARYMALYDERRQLQSRLAELMKDGFMALAHARYSTQYRDIGSSQFPATMEASLTVNVAGSAPHMEAVRVKRETVRKEPADSEGKSQPDTAESTSLRRRKNPSKENEARDAEGPGADKEPETKSAAKAPAAKASISHVDPLRWFGVLVPRDLRTCQQRFIEATDVAVQIASVTAELDTYVRTVGLLRDAAAETDTGIVSAAAETPSKSDTAGPATPSKGKGTPKGKKPLQAAQTS